MSKLTSFFRLIGAGFVLARYDALVPPTFSGLVPSSLRLVGFVSRFGRSIPVGNRGERLARALERLGPSYVKLGQFLATRSDILSRETIEGLSTLKDQMEPFSQEQATAILAKEFGENWQELFIEFGPAIAAASVAQVHKASTKNKKQIAVKLLRPGIRDRVFKDIESLEMGAKLLERWLPSSRRLEPVRFVATVARSLLLEMDLRMEAAACSELGEIAEDIKGVYIPQPDWELTREHILAIDWVDGIALTSVQELQASQTDMVELAKIISASFLAFALNHGVFHADQHEGNLFALADGRLALVDFGIVGRIGPAQRRYLAEILYGFLKRDYRRIAEVHFEAGYVPKTHLVDDFAQALRAVGEPVFGKRASDVSMGRLLLQLFTITARFDMHLRPELVLLQKTMVQVEGVARSLDPDHDLWGAAAPIIEEWIKRELGPEGQLNEIADDLLDLRDAVRELPASLHNMAEIVRQTSDRGFALDDDSLKRLSRGQARAHRIRDTFVAAAALVTGLAALKWLL